jgi:hypothetical protein
MERREKMGKNKKSQSLKTPTLKTPSVDWIRNEIKKEVEKQLRDNMPRDMFFPPPDLDRFESPSQELPREEWMMNPMMEPLDIPFLGDRTRKSGKSAKNESVPKHRMGRDDWEFPEEMDRRR